MSQNSAHERPLVAGNWKMNGVKGDIAEAAKVANGVTQGDFGERADVMICPPATLISAVAEALRSTPVQVGAQDCHVAKSGAHTGDISPEMLADAGATAVIVGHSERRIDHGETDALVRAKAAAANRAGLLAIVCVGETAGQRRAGLTLDVVARQIKGSVPVNATAATAIIAYEPVWAIGTGLTPTLKDVGEVHALIRRELAAAFGTEGARVRILYGGSVKPANAHDLLRVPNVGGALVGGASLKADDFLGIVRACPSRSA